MYNKNKYTSSVIYLLLYIIYIWPHNSIVFFNFTDKPIYLFILLIRCLVKANVTTIWKSISKTSSLMYAYLSKQRLRIPEAGLIKTVYDKRVP